MAQTTSVASSRVERRKARTRSALLGAAQRFLAEGNTTVSIQEITDAADVGFGSFYNHFSTKEELFAEAVAITLDAWAVVRDEIVAGMDDPVQIYATSFRMSGRLQRVYPELVRVLLHSGMSVLLTDRGLRPRAIADIELGMASGRFDVSDSELGLMLSGGLILALLQMLDADDSLDDGAVSDEFAARALAMLGVEKAEIADIVGQPLPPMPALY